MLSDIKENEGKLKEAADILFDLQVGSLGWNSVLVFTFM
jgi:hypothetical protein